MGHMHEHLDKRRLADLAADPDFMPHRADAQIASLQALRAERAVLATAAQAIDVSQRYCFERDLGSYPTLLDVLIADAVIDPAFEYVDVSVPCLSCELTVGFTYDPGSRPAPTSPQFFELTGDPGDPGEGDELIVFEVWVRGIEISPAMSDEANEQIAKAVRAKIAALIVESNEP